MHSIANDLLPDLSRGLAGAPAPGVKALHLPPAPWNGSKDGEFGALDNGAGRVL